MSFWPKSRYTASLEQQVTELKAHAAQAATDAKAQIDYERQQAKASEDRRVQQVSELRADLLHERDQVSQLTVKLVETIKAKADVTAKPQDKKEPPRAGNWLKTRSALESQDQIVSEINPDKEKSANGSR